MEGRARGFDAAQRLWPQAEADNGVLIVAIDEESLAAKGQWPWPRTLVAELVRLNVDILVVSGVGYVGVLAAKQATTTIPIVMVSLATDPVEAGLVESLARPGGNITGFTIMTIEMAGKRLELFKEAVAHPGPCRRPV